MASVTYYVVVPFNRDEEGNLVPGEAKEAPNGDRARRLAMGLADKYAGAIAFYDGGNYLRDAQTIAVFGAVDVSALGG